MTYLLAAQLALSQVPGSLLAAAAGWGAGVAWRNDLLPAQIAGWRVPGWVVGEERRQGFEVCDRGPAWYALGLTCYKGLQRRLEGESRATGVSTSDPQDQGGEARQRRGWGRAVLDGFRGSF